MIKLTQASLPKGGGAIRGIGETFQPHEFTGTSALSIPIPTSACRGFEPRLSLDYSSGLGNGVFGLGWALSISSIARKTAKGIPRYDGSDTFILASSEELVPVADGGRRVKVGAVDYAVSTYRPRIEGLFAKIERWVVIASGDSYWRVIGKDNLTSVYGAAPQTRICDPDPENPDHVFQWLLQETFDAKGNRAIYEYGVEPAEDANRYLERIKYGNDRPLTTKENEPGKSDTAPNEKITWHFEVVFDYGKFAPESCRKDPFSSYKSGFEIRTRRLCHQIQMFHRFENEDKMAEPLLAGAIHFDYESQPTITYLRSVTRVGYQSGVAKEMPPLKFEYSRVDPAKSAKFEPLTLESVHQTPGFQDIPGFLANGDHQMVDLYGEGLPGILYTDDDAVRYWRPQGEGRFAPSVSPDQFPIERNLQSAAYALTDLEGDGALDLVVTTPARSGYYESHHGSWEPFRSFATTPTELLNPQRQMVDVTGDGRADLLLFESDAVTAYASKGKLGYDQAQRQSSKNPLPVTSHPSAREAIRFADMFGDGGSHLVRIRNGSVECWPNLGYGRFGSKVEMANPPSFGIEMDASRLFLTDIDGSGTADLVYAYPDHVDIYRNESGNGFSAPVSFPLPRTWNDLSQISFADVLGNGTACLLFASVNDDLSLNHQYCDFTGGVKPHLLIEVDNNMGATTRIHYGPSTKFYLADENAGTPWCTRLPFPVHVVEKTETVDHICGSRLVASYTYHHGYFDPIDREFRGFGRVERMDAESFEKFSAGDANNRSLDVPPVLTKTWYHTGAYAAASIFSQQYAAEYYNGDDQAHPLPDAVLDAAFQKAIPENTREACRALQGQVLREEVYGLDDQKNPALAKNPYTVTESNFYVRLIQPKADRQHAVCFVHSRETISYHYERNPADPRISHALTLKVDEFGNVLNSVAIAYGRRTASTDPVLTADDKARQSRLLITCTENVFTNLVLTPDDYHTPLPAETRTFELTGFKPENNAGRFSFDEWTRNGFALPSSAAAIPYEQTANNTIMQKQVIEHVRTLYRPDDLGASQKNDPLALLPLGEMQRLALPGESYKLAFTAGLLTQVFRRAGQSLLPNPVDVLAVHEPGNVGRDRGGYIDLDSDGHWWIPAGRVFLSPKSEDDSAHELEYATSHFFLPHRTRDPFHTAAFSTESFVTYDAYDLLVLESRDALGNVVTYVNDYRVLKPRLVTDPNGNRTALAFDALGMVVATAVMGKEGENLGDLLEDFGADPLLAELQAFLADPQPKAASLLGKATTRFIYDLDRYQRAGQPPFAVTLSRETHVSDRDGALTKIQIGFSYADGFGREIQKKIQAEAGDAPQRNEPVQLPKGDISPGDLVRDGQSHLKQANTLRRWVGTGRTVFNNKGKPVKQYEPFFSSTHLYETESEMTDTGVTPILFYDPLERVVATLHPNHTFEKVVFDPWRQETWDVNDTVLVTDPQNDPDVGDFFSRLPEADFLPTWYAQRHNGQLSTDADEKTTAVKAAAHAATPTIANFDALGRPMLTVADNGKDANGAAQKYATRVTLDIEGNHRELIDAHGRIAMRYDYDMLGNRIHEASMDAGERWMLNDVAGKPLYHWDSKNRRFRTAYDPLRRHTDSFTSEGAEAEKMLGRIVYGETLQLPEKNNLRGKIVQIFDQAGVITSHEHDFKGNLIRSQRQLAQEYKTTLDWSAAPQPKLEAPIYTSRTSYDALNRPTELIAPDNSVVHHTYNEANLLERLEANVCNAAVATVFINSIEYDAKGQRTRIIYGNGARTIYTYDPLTFHLIHLQTERGPERLQDLRYTYDPAGNITHIRDDAQQTIFFNGQVVPPQCDYTYDAIYRLIIATGREHLGQQVKPPETTWNDEFRIHVPQPNDGQAMRNYSEQYLYDAVGNFEKLIHQATDGNWTRTHICNEPSLLEPGKTSNRLTTTQVGNNSQDKYVCDAHGNMTSMPHLSKMQWDHHDQLRATAQQSVSGGTPETTWYVYDAGGKRVRQVTEAHAAAGQTPVRRKERLYLGGFEVYREYGNDGVSARLERETLHIMDDQQRIALVETRTQGEDKAPTRLVRYQFDNHLGSASLELDEEAKIISYEEYTPFGSTAYQAVRSQTETPKRYRYSGKERDDSTGLYYYGARYYAPWLGRWVSPDPAGTVDGLNLYLFVGSDPIGYGDHRGTCKTKKPRKDMSTLARLRRAEERFNARSSSGRRERYYPEQMEAARKVAQTGKTLRDVDTPLGFVNFSKFPTKDPGVRITTLKRKYGGEKVGHKYSEISEILTDSPTSQKTLAKCMLAALEASQTGKLKNPKVMLSEKERNAMSKLLAITHTSEPLRVGGTSKEVRGILRGVEKEETTFGDAFTGDTPLFAMSVNPDRQRRIVNLEGKKQTKPPGVHDYFEKLGGHISESSDDDEADPKRRKFSSVPHD